MQRITEIYDKGINHMAIKFSVLGLLLSITALALAILSAINFYLIGDGMSQGDFVFMSYGYPIVPALFAVWYFVHSLRKE